MFFAYLSLSIATGAMMLGFIVLLLGSATVLAFIVKLLTILGLIEPKKEKTKSYFRAKEAIDVLAHMSWCMHEIKSTESNVFMIDDYEAATRYIDLIQDMYNSDKQHLIKLNK